MIKKIKKLHQIYKQQRYKENIQYLENPQSGLSPFERERAMKFPQFTDGQANFFGKPFHFSHGPSFIHSVDELYNDEIYKFITETDKPYIIDCGANIGVSIHYFKKLYKNAEILAFEPDEHIFELLQKNVSDFENVTIEKKAVWIEDTTLEFFSEGALAGSLVADFGNKNNVMQIQAVDLKKYLNRKVDFLKIDIEGAENKIIFDIENHLHNVNFLFLEYHGIKKDDQNLDKILNLLTTNNFRYYIESAAHRLVNHPYIDESPVAFDLQLNIFCKRII